MASNPAPAFPTMAPGNSERSALAEAGQRFDRRGLAAATSGNYSARLDDGTLLLTRSGRHMGRLGAADFIRLDKGGAPLEPGAPSAETGLHLMLYRRYPDAKAILHWHSPLAVGLSRAVGAAAWRFADHEMLKAFPGVTTHDTHVTIPVVDNSQNMDVIETAVAPALTDTTSAFMIRSHGLYAWGTDVAEAERIAEAVEWLLAAHQAERSFA
jgi:methylthioribulose-1-phosphate dehydratase